MSGSLSVIAGERGNFIVNDVAEVTKQFVALQALEDTVIASLKERAGTDQKAEYIQTPGTAIKAGTIIRVRYGDMFTAITLTSGSVALILN